MGGCGRAGQRGQLSRVDPGPWEGWEVGWHLPMVRLGMLARIRRVVEE